MLKSIYSRIFYFCTVALMFGCALTGVIVVVFANQMYESKANSSIDSTARIILKHTKDLYAQTDSLQADVLRAEYENYSLADNIDCYLFDLNGKCLVRSDYSNASIVLTDVVREAAAQQPYRRNGSTADTFTEPTATYVEQFTLDNEPYYLMLVYPITNLNQFSGKLMSVVIITVLGIGVLGALLFYFNTSQMIKPLHEITQAAESYAKGDFSERLAAQSGDAEMDYLATTMNRMADFIDHNERSRKSFVSDVSHELRTPMTTIGGFVDSILNGTIPPEQQKHYLKIVSSEVNRMTRMVQSMLNISKFEEGSMKPDFKQFDITHLLIQTLLLFEEKAEAKHLAVEGLEDCRKTLVVADKDLMQQVFYNLTENAIKFVNEGGKLTLSVEKDEEQAHIHMRNTGEGLTEQELSRIFDRFYKTDASRGKDTTGVGLGLSIVSRIMVLHGGTVTVKSVYGEYTEFIVSLPLIQPIKPQKEQA